ncbi:helix-turn-helix domain-containing protein [Streptomyces sp. NPDC057579]|uniref:helix-turn-helix domain-containing protein n=1 Tax=Streptomyces sp. NPDC057579 TaxID=3346172 RepID=UPI0036798B6D
MSNTRVPVALPGTERKRTDGGCRGVRRLARGQLRRNGMSQAGFARRLDLTRAAVSDWGTGRAQPRAKLMTRITETLPTDVVTRGAEAGSS